MKIFVVKTNKIEYDTFDSFVIVAESKTKAIEIGYQQDWGYNHNPGDLSANEIDLNISGVKHESYNAG